jgi:holin-like protein
LLFIAPAVGLLESWQTMQEFLAAFIAITLISTITVTAAAGHVTQYIIKLKNRQKK